MQSNEPIAFYIITVIIGFAVSIISFLIARIFKSNDKIFDIISTIQKDVAVISSNVSIHNVTAESLKDKSKGNADKIDYLGHEINRLTIAFNELKNKFDNHNANC